VIWPIYGLKIDYDTVKLRKVTYDVVLWCHKDYATTSSKWRHKIFPLLIPSLSKILVALLCGVHYCTAPPEKNETVRLLPSHFAPIFHFKHVVFVDWA